MAYKLFPVGVRDRRIEKEMEAAAVFGFRASGLGWLLGNEGIEEDSKGRIFLGAILRTAF